MSVGAARGSRETELTVNVSLGPYLILQTSYSLYRNFSSYLTPAVGLKRKESSASLLPGFRETELTVTVRLGLWLHIFIH